MTKDQLYEYFGEMLYAVAMADGKVHDNQWELIESILKEYEWGTNVFWSFNYEDWRQRSIKEAYDRALDAFKEYGPFEDYPRFFEILEKVAELNLNLEHREERMIRSFKETLIEHFKNDPKIQFRADALDDELEAAENE